MQKDYTILSGKNAMLESGILKVYFEAFSSKNEPGTILINNCIQIYSIDFRCCSFTGKERDEETGYGYFGARYMDYELLTSFISIDRYSDKYPSISPYAYCTWNPIRLTDPTGDTIFNAYEKYKDVSYDIQCLMEEKEKTGFFEFGKRISIRREIRNLRKLNQKYNRVQNALDAFKEANFEEYNKLDNLECNGKNVNITIYASDDFRAKNGATGNTRLRFSRRTQTDEIVGVNSIKITLFRIAFLNGNNGLATLANEFGDALFAVSKFQNQYENAKVLEEQRKQGNYNYYYQVPTTNFSYDYEHYILNPQKNNKPDPDDY